MTASQSRLATLAMLCVLAVAAGSVIAAPDEELPPMPPPPPAPAPTSDQTKGGTKQGSDEKKKSEQQFRDGYVRARALIMSGQYQDGIAAMRTLGRDDNPEVANFIGYASRKLGRYEDSRFWYERALAADPNHVRTWSYYGMWHAEQGNILKARDHLEKVQAICGNTTCKEYVDLKGVIEGSATY
jgi:tetratricopeptide (TPR) repeat protein